MDQNHLCIKIDQKISEQIPHTSVIRDLTFVVIVKCARFFLT
jgi:hypothetical protein